MTIWSGLFGIPENVLLSPSLPAWLPTVLQVRPVPVPGIAVIHFNKSYPSDYWSILSIETAGMVMVPPIVDL